MNCRHCHTPLDLRLVDLGTAPPSNAYLRDKALQSPELWFPLRVMVCRECWLVQTEDFAQADQLFDSEYAYFSGFSSSWLDHSERYVNTMVERFGLGADSRVVEVAANDGYLLQYVRERGIPCLGVEPTASTAAAARAKGLEVVERFFGVALAEELVDNGWQADLTAANNVLAHVPDINDFSAGFARLLKPTGVATFEFPHLLNLIQQNQFDTIYHEHFSYLSLTAVTRIFRAAGLVVFDVEELSTHGGSLRVFARRADGLARPESARVSVILARETDAGLSNEAGYTGFQACSERVKDDFLRFLLEAKRDGLSVAGYGAAAKGNTLLNYAGVGPDLLRFAVDRNPAKVGKFLPGSRIPIVDETWLRRERPDFVVLLPWNLHEELITQLAFVREWGARFVIAVPKLEIHPS